MSKRHLSSGSNDVPMASGKVRLYSMRFCPYSHRVHLVLFAKNIPHDVVYINLKQKPGWYFERFPLGKVPGLVDGENIYESDIICDFLDEKYEGNPLYPSDPGKKAKDRILIDMFNQVITFMYRCYTSPIMDVAHLVPVFDSLGPFERELGKRGSAFFSGEKPGMVDYMIWPWFERLEMIRIMGGEEFKFPNERFPKLLKWSNTMTEDEAVKKHFLTPEQHAKFYRTFRDDAPDYDIIF